MNEYLDQPAQYAIYKGLKGTNGAIQFNLRRFDPERAANETDNRKKQEKMKKGYILVDAAPTSGVNVYNWEKDIKFAMNENDIAQFLANTNQIYDPDTVVLELIHKHEKSNSTKKMKLVQGKEFRGEPSWMLTMSSTEDGGRIATIPIAKHELLLIRALFTAAIPTMLGWAI